MSAVWVARGQEIAKKIQSSKLTDDMADIDSLRDDIYIKGESA
jgi:hypothetical protein